MQSWIKGDNLVLVMNNYGKVFLTICVSLAAYPFTFSDWMAGSAKIKITPETPIYLSGYASRNQPFTSVKQDLWAKALVLEDESGKRAVIITTDLVGVYNQASPAIYAGITERTGIERPDILLTWSHTHSGPRLTVGESPGRDASEEDTKNSIAYTKHLQERLIHLVELATRSLQPVELSWGAGFAPFVMNRRQRTSEGIRLNPNPSGHVDRSLPCLKVEASDGKLMAVLFQVACHNTTLGSKNYAVCGDYSGFAQSKIENMYPGTKAMFMTGCAGNANPYPRGTMELAQKHGQTVADEVHRLLESDFNPVKGPLTTVLDNARLSLQPVKPVGELEDIMANGPSWLKTCAGTMLEVLKRGDPLPTYYDAPVSVWQFGNDLTLVAMSGEVVSGYVLRTQTAIGHQKLWVAAYCHDYFGYLPTAQILRDGGYETRGLFNGMGFFAEQAEEDMVKTVTRLAKEAGRTFE